MQFIRIKSLQCYGLETQAVSVEVLKSSGISQISLTGLPDAWLRDSRDKIRALVSRMVEWGPLCRVLVHLLPADEDKFGAHLELAIILGCMAVLKTPGPNLRTQKLLAKYKFVGSVTLDGRLENTPLSSVLQQRDPEGTLGPAQFSTLAELWDFLLQGDEHCVPKIREKNNGRNCGRYACEIKGRYWERLWLLVAAIAETPVLLVGPPGSGKSHLARWAHRLLPEPTEARRFTVQQVWTLAGATSPYKVPLLTPHARCLLVEFLGVVRKGVARPGLYSLAHGGLLILDEFTEMNRDSREVLRNILDQKNVTRVIGKGFLEWPADFWLIATANPCPCGYSGSNGSSPRCRCMVSVKRIYENKMSGPILDRMGLRLFVGTQSSDQESIGIIDHSLLDGLGEPLDLFVKRKREELPTHLEMASKLSFEHQLFLQRSERERHLKTRMLAALMSLEWCSPNQCLSLLILLTALEANILQTAKQPSLEINYPSHASLS